MIPTLQNFFETPHGNLQIYDLVAGNHLQHLDTLLGLYRELFPQYGAARANIRTRAFLPANIDPRFIRHQWLVMWNASPAGLVSFRFALQRSLGLCLSIAIRPAYRLLAWDGYRRLSEFLLQRMIAQLEADAALSGVAPPRAVVVEIEAVSNPMADPARMISLLHLAERYREYGFVPLPITYHEPAFVRSGSSDHPMQLYVLPIHATFRKNLLSANTLHEIVDTLLLDHYGLLDENDWVVKQARQSIENAGERKNESRS
jgi:hypothetical protein